MIPLFHDFDGKQVLIFGGGPVAARKAALFETEADVTVRSKEFIDRFSELDCQCVRTDIDPDLAAQYVDSAFLVIPATDDPTLNDRLAEAAHAVGGLVNRVDEAGETVTPSVVAGDHVTVGISTGGASPAVSKFLRQRLEDEIEAIDPMVALQSELRETVGRVPEPERQAFLWDVLEDDRIRAALRAEDWDRARTLAEGHRP